MDVCRKNPKKISYLVQVPANELENLEKNCGSYAVLHTMEGCIFCDQMRPVVRAAVCTGGTIPTVEVTLRGNEEYMKKKKIDAFPDLRRYPGAKFFEGKRTKEDVEEFLRLSPH